MLPWPGSRSSRGRRWRRRCAHIILYYIILYYIILYYIILYAAVARFALFAWAALEAPLCMPTVCPFGEDVVFIANDWQAPHTI